ncbi:hypothetical protein MTO96_011201 [Rhipicephalus appendiculatus]
MKHTSVERGSPPSTGLGIYVPGAQGIDVASQIANKESRTSRGDPATTVIHLDIEPDVGNTALAIVEVHRELVEAELFLEKLAPRNGEAGSGRRVS